MTPGEEVWNMLRSEGGFVWTTADGRQFVHFNRGRRCSRKLRAVLREYRDDLKAFVCQRHAVIDAWLRRPPGGVGSSGRGVNPAPKGRNADGCECNADLTSEYAHTAPLPNPCCAGETGSAPGVIATKSCADGGYAAKSCAFGANGEKAEVCR